MNIRRVIAVALVSVWTFTAYAQAKKPTTVGEKVKKRSDEIASDLDSYNEGQYGMAGCGLGAMVFDNGSPQVLAATTNGSFYSQFFGISSGTSKCVDEKRTAMEQQVFIENNYAQLSIEAARGDGDRLRAFAELLGCDEKEFVEFSRAKHEDLFTGDPNGRILEVYKEGIGDHCKRLG